MSDVGFDLAKEAASGIFRECGIDDCDKFSMGFVCHLCSRFSCNRHTYFQLGAPPKSVCAACVVRSHPELFEEK